MCSTRRTRSSSNSASTACVSCRRPAPGSASTICSSDCRGRSCNDRFRKSRIACAAESAIAGERSRATRIARAADLYEVSAAPKHAQPSPLHLPKILGHKPAVDLRIDETTFCAVAAEERSSAKREATIVFASRLEMIEQFFFDADGRATLAHTVGRENGPAECARIVVEIAGERAAADENRAQRCGRAQLRTHQIVYLRWNERRECRVR